MADVTFQRSEYERALPDWQTVNDVCAGSRAVKYSGRAKEYLPDPNGVADETRREKDAVYKRYKQRASFYNVAGRTLEGLVGAVFRKPATISLPGRLEYLISDADGAGVGLAQQARSTLAAVLKTGRHGLLVDYPQTDAPASRADQEAGLIRANIVRVAAEDVINWRTTKIGARHLLSLVVISEQAVEVTEDSFGLETVQQYRVLRLDENGEYAVELWRWSDEARAWVLYDGPHYPKSGAGQTWGEIPFVFPGSQNNDADVDKAPLLDLAEINLKHYQVGADWYNALHYAGQPQPVMAGLTVEWRDHLEAQGVVLGSRAPLMLPEGGTFSFATVEADTALQTELEALEKRMVALGARLIQPGEAAKTATEAQDDNETSHSVLSLAASNVSDAYRQALQWAAEFEAETGESDFALSEDFAELQLRPEMAKALIELWQSGTVPKNDVFNYLRSRGLIDPEKTNDEVMDELETAGGPDLNGGP